MCLSPSGSLCDTHMHTQMHNTHSMYPQCTQTTHVYLPFFTRRHYVHTNPCTMHIHTQHSCMAHTHSTQTHIPPTDMHTIYIYSMPISHIYSLTNTTCTLYRHTYDSHTPPKHTLHAHTHTLSTHIHPPPRKHMHTNTSSTDTQTHMLHTRVHAHTLAAQLSGLHTCSVFLYPRLG